MKLKTKERTFFKNNPIKEVIAQVRFPENLEIQDSLPVAFQKEITKDFPYMGFKKVMLFHSKLGIRQMVIRLLGKNKAPF